MHTYACVLPPSYLVDFVAAVADAGGAAVADAIAGAAVGGGAAAAAAAAAAVERQTFGCLYPPSPH